MDSFRSPTKKKIILMKSKLMRKPPDRTATFGGCLALQQQKPIDSNSDVKEDNSTSFDCHKLVLAEKLWELIKFHQQLNTVESFICIKNRSDRLLKAQEYLTEKLRKRNIFKTLDNLKNSKKYKLVDSSSSEHVKIQSINISKSYVNIQSYKKLQKRVKQLQIMMKQNLCLRSPRVSFKPKTLFSNRKYILDLPQTTDSGMSRVILNNQIISPMNRRHSINIDDGKEYSCLSFRTSNKKEKGLRGRKNSVIVLRSKFSEG